MESRVRATEFDEGGYLGYWRKRVDVELARGRVQDRQAETELVLPRVDAPRDQGGGRAARPLPLLGRSASMEAVSIGDQKAPERK